MGGPALAAILLFATATARADDPSLRARFAGEEAWMLSVVLSDPEQQKAFDADVAAASNGDAAAKTAFENRWRKRIVEFANAYHQHLTSKDIAPNAPSVERMVDDWELAVMNHWLNHQTEKRRKEVLKDLADGNSVLGFMRGAVEGRVRDNRREAAEKLARYVVSPSAVAAVKFVERPAIDVARRASGNGRAAERPGATPEEAARRVGEVFNGTPPKPGDATPPPVDAGKPVVAPVPAGGGRAPAPELARGGLTAPVTSSLGGFRIAPPPSPIVDRDSTAPKKSAWSVIARKAAPTVGGGLLGALLGFLVAGPIGALVGAAVGAAAGYAAGKAL